VRRVLIAVLLLAALAGGIIAAHVRAESHGRPGIGFWHTAGTRILDAEGRQVRIAAVTWYGMESERWVPAGLKFRSHTEIMNLVKALGYNAIRLPLSNEVVERNPPIPGHVESDPSFLGKPALQLLDAIAAYAHQIGLKIILDDHLSRATRTARVNFLMEPLWYTAEYPESSWIRDWVALTRRYQNNDAVVGFDLRNEPHTAGPGPWDLHAYLHQGATWGPYRGVENPATDWRRAAERAGNAVLAVNPHLLIFVEGVQLYPDPRQASGASAFWWGSNLSPARQYPVVLSFPHQLVYSPHDWGPWKWNMPYFTNMDYASMQRIWHDKWGYLLDDPGAPNAAPIWLGEFGTCTTNPGCVDREAPGNQARWFHLLLRFLGDHPEVGWSFFALNGTNSNTHITNNGLLNPTWTDVSRHDLQADLARIQ
jgi:endoglucanase